MFLSKLKKLITFFFRLYGLYILFFICVGLLSNILPELDLKKYSQDALFEMIKNNKLKAFFAMVVLAPVIEEFMFRTLLRPSKNDLILFFSAWSLFLMGLIIPIHLEWYYKYCISLLILLLLFIVYYKTIPTIIFKKIRTYLTQQQIWVLQITAVVFGFLHIFNYVDSFMIDNVLFLMIVPRIIAGHLFGRIKIENKHIIWPILLHAMNNGVVFLIISTRF